MSASTSVRATRAWLEAWSTGDESKILKLVRTELRRELPPEDVAAYIEVLVDRGTGEDIELLECLLQRADLAPQTRDMAREIRRRLQERAFRLEDILHEEQQWLCKNRTVASSRSWVAVRLGRTEAVGDSRAEVEAAIARKQQQSKHPEFFAIILRANEELAVWTRW